MIKSKVITQNGVPELFVNGKHIEAAAYITYFPERGEYSDFASAGYRLYSVCAYFSDLPINEMSGFTPCTNGIFDTEDKPDYTDIDDEIARVLAACPDALIFPRIYVTMPRWWLTRHPEDIGPVKTSSCGRELLCSNRFREDGAAMLTAFIDRMESMPYADHIIGYQIAGGATQEWFWFDLHGALDSDGNLTQNILPFFKHYLDTTNTGYNVEQLPQVSEDNMLREHYCRFASHSVAATIRHLAHTAKATLHAQKVVGVFYGYSLEVADPLWGSHALTDLLDDTDIDFFSSPVSYRGGRALGTDSCDMIPAASVLHHGKLYFLEADIRTHQSLSMVEARPDRKLAYPYPAGIFRGGADSHDDILHTRKTFAKALTQSRSLWWFDMFGGWYHCAPVMKEMSLYRQIWEEPYTADLLLDCKIAVYVDESVYGRIPNCPTQASVCLAAADAGIPYDVFLSSDFYQTAHFYRLCILAQPDLTPESEAICQYAAAHGITVLFGNGMSAEEIIDAVIQSGYFLISENRDILYAGNGYIAVHAVSGGVKKLQLPFSVIKIRDLFGNAFDLSWKDNSITFFMEKHDTVLLAVQREDI